MNSTHKLLLLNTLVSVTFRGNNRSVGFSNSHFGLWPCVTYRGKGCLAY